MSEILDGKIFSNQLIAGYRTQIYLNGIDSSSQKHSKNLSVFKDVVMYHDIYVMSMLANNITTLSGIMMRGNYYYLKDKNLLNNSHDYYTLLGRYLFHFKKTGIMNIDVINTFLSVFENLIIDVDPPHDYYSHRRRGEQNQECFLEEKDTGDNDLTAPFDDIMMQVAMDFIFPVKGQSLASSGMSAYQMQ